jgi:hypothetical protein
MQDLLNMPMGENTRLNDIVNMADLALVGQYLGRIMNNVSLKEWTKENFEHVVGRFP